MTLGDLLDAMDRYRNGDETIQVCSEGGEWEDYDELIICSRLLDPILRKRVKCFSAIREDCIRVDIDWSDNE